MEAPGQAPKPVKRKYNRIPPSVKTEIVARRVNKQQITTIAREMEISRPTVYKVLDETNIDAMLESGRLGIARLIPKAIDVVDARLGKGSESAAFGVLNGIGVIGKDSFQSKSMHLQTDVCLQVAIQTLLEPKKNETKEQDRKPDNP